MGTGRLYIATNEETGEVITGSSRELAERFGIVLKSFHNYVGRGTKANGVWRIADSDQFAEKKSIWKEWDDFTEPIRQYMKRRRRK